MPTFPLMFCVCKLSFYYSKDSTYVLETFYFQVVNIEKEVNKKEEEIIVNCKRSTNEDVEHTEETSRYILKRFHFSLL